MTESEAIKWQEAFKKTYNGFPKESSEACDVAISAIEEIQQYRALGTVEELREAMEKQRAKKPVRKPYDWEDENDPDPECDWHCPNCGKLLTDRIPGSNKDFYFYCLNCGQKFDWSLSRKQNLKRK